MENRNRPMPSPRAIELAQIAVCSEIFAEGKKAELLAACGDWLNEVKTAASEAADKGIPLAETWRWHEKEEDAALHIMQLAMQFHGGTISAQLVKEEAMKHLEIDHG